jgi:hypothetical protein
LFEEFKQELIRIEEVDMDQLSSLQKQAALLHQKVEALQKKPNK